MSEEEVRERAVQGLITKEIIKREQVVTIFSITLPYGYPIPTVQVKAKNECFPWHSFQRDTELARAHEVLEGHDIYSRGRFGGWKYEVSNQDHCFIQAINEMAKEFHSILPTLQGKELCDRLLLGQPEKLYKTLVPEKRG